MGILGLLIVAGIWTYIVLIKYFIEFLASLVSTRNVTVDKIFENEHKDIIDK